MRERDRISAVEHQLELQAIEEQAREERERPIREATEQLEKNYYELTKVYKERLIGKVPDPERFIDPAVGPSVKMSLKDAQTFTAQQWQLFVGQHPELYAGSELLDLIDSYCKKESISIITVAMFERMIERFAACGLLPERPAPVETVNDTPEPESETPTGPQMFDGFDPYTDLPITLTKRQVDRLSADEYRRFAKVRTADLDLRGWGPGPRGRQ